MAKRMGGTLYIGKYLLNAVSINAIRYEVKTDPFMPACLPPNVHTMKPLLNIPPPKVGVIKSKQPISQPPTPAKIVDKPTVMAYIPLTFIPTRDEASLSWATALIAIPLLVFCNMNVKIPKSRVEIIKIKILW